MPDILVLDASALCKLVRNERESADVRTKVRNHLEAGGQVWTDEIAATEIVTCARKALDEGEGRLDDVIQGTHDALAVAHLVRREADAGHDLSGLIKLAHELGLAGPDARYVELAIGHRLLTFDAKQAQAAKKKGIQLA